MGKILLAIICTVLAAALAYFVSQNFEYYSEEVDRGWSNEAKINDYLALQRFLEGQSLSVDAIVSLPIQRRLELVDVLLIPKANQIQLESQKTMILAWVANGGTLLIGAGYGEAPPIIEDFQFSVTFLDTNLNELENMSLDDDSGRDNDTLDPQDEDEKEKSLAEKWREHNQRLNDADSESSAENDPNRVNTKRALVDNPQQDSDVKCLSPGDYCGIPEEPKLKDKSFTSIPLEQGQTAKLHIQSRTVLEHVAFGSSYGDAYIELGESTGLMNRWQGNEEGVTYAQLQYGSGAIHIFTNLEFLNNHHVSHFGHSFFISELLDSKTSLLILFGEDMPSLGQLVYRHFFEALVAFALMIGCALFYLGRRLGKIKALALSDRRSRAERYMAVASFRWRNGDQQRLLASAREHVLKKATRRWPKFEKGSKQEQLRFLAECSELEQDDIDIALHQTEEFSENTFTHIIKVLQALRNCL